MIENAARLAAETALRDSEARLAFAMEAHALGLFEWEIATGRLIWSPGSEARLGLRPDSITTIESWRAQVFADDAETVFRTVADAASRHLGSYAFHYRVYQPDGSVRSVEGTARCIYDADGTLIRTTGVNIDVTRRVEREVALQGREAQLRSILETVPDAMVVIDERGLIHSFSAAAERMFGYDAAELIGQNVSILTPDSIRDHHDSYLARYLATGERRVIGSTRLLAARRRDGSEMPIELSVGEATDGPERLFTGFVRDISDRVAGEQRTNDLRGELAQVARVTAMGEMASGLAHELNQPLSATVNFLGAAELLARREGDRAQIADLVGNAKDQILRAGDIIRNLREFIAKRDVEMSIEPVEKTVRDAVALVHVGSARFDIDVHYAFEHGNNLVLADRVQIQQVLVNILRNATEAMHGQPRHQREISIATRSVEDDMIEISVGDRGPGIADSFLDRVFAPFSSTKGEGGLGLGLSICRRIVEAHGGKLSAGNRPGSGAIFRFTLRSATADSAS